MRKRILATTVKPAALLLDAAVRPGSTIKLPDETITRVVNANQGNLIEHTGGFYDVRNGHYELLRY